MMTNNRACAAPVRRANPQRIKLHRIYSTTELATCCGVHKNTVRYWQTKGLEAISTIRPILFEGGTVRTFLAERKCRQPRPPALGMVEFVQGKATTGDLSALCGECGTIMHRRASKATIGNIMPNLDVQIREAEPRLIERTPPSLNCDKRKD
jgi:hypothetical protein